MTPWDMSINIDFGGRTPDPDMVLGHSLDPAVAVFGGSKGRPEHYGPSGSMDRGLKEGQRRQPRLLESA